MEVTPTCFCHLLWSSSGSAYLKGHGCTAWWWA